MKLLLSISLIMSLLYPKTTLNIENVYGSYCVMCMNDGSILASKNAEYTQSVASISKVMSAIIAIESCDIKDKVIVDEIIYEATGSSVYLKENEEYTLEDLLYGLMLRSGNDAALVIAKHVSKSVDKFVRKMNEKATQIGMKATIFNNPSGLDEKDGGNISTSCDMALLMRYAMKNETFRNIVNAKSYTLENGKVWLNKNRFLKDYKYATGGKTGYTKLAKRTLITTSKKDDMEVVVVSLHISDDFNQHKNAHTWAYENYDVIKILEQGKYSYKNKRIDINEDFYQTIEKNDVDSMKIYTRWEDMKFKITSTYKMYKNTHSYEVIYE